MSEMENRIEFLRQVAIEEELEFNERSTIGLTNFVASFGQPEAIFLRDNGNLAGRFTIEDYAFSVEFINGTVARATILGF